MFRPCTDAQFSGPYCNVSPAWSAPWSGSVDYEITVTELTTEVRTSRNTTTPGVPFFYNRSAVATVAPAIPRLIGPSYKVAAAVGPPYTNVRVTGDITSFTVLADIMPGTPPGLVTGNLFIKVCRDDPAICAFPHKGSPFNVPISTMVVDSL
jgi:hypothetical protein